MVQDEVVRRTLCITRKAVESGDVTEAIELLRPLIADREAAYAFRGRYRIMVLGWDEDPRELWEIPEVRSHLRRLDEAFPYWYWFLEPGGSFMLMAACSCELVPQAGRTHPRRVAVAIMPAVLVQYLMQRCNATMALARQIGLEPEDVVQSFSMALAWFGREPPFVDVDPGLPRRDG